ncbi:MAG: nucleotidyltransferase family protein [Saprospiraceae bacterium]|nr:nucleotidyltransferase family protein [Saprospiraceae bacterium]
MHLKTKNISLILLAAGESSRLGTPKQLLMYRGKTLMQHTIDQTQTLGLDTFIVLGAFSEQIISQINTYDAKVVINKNWNEGLASSIRCGLEQVLQSNPDTEAVILILCDQPFLTIEILQQILEKYHDSSLPIVHCNYGEASGPPTLFHRSLFPYLMELKDHEGAKKVVNKYPADVALVDFADGKFDIDTLADYQHLLQTQDLKKF